MAKIPSTKIFKSQITKHKYQTNPNDQSSKSQTIWSLENCDLRFIWNLVLEIWDLNEFIFQKDNFNTHLRFANYIIRDTRLILPAYLFNTKIIPLPD
jgi:hypothetical protein